MAGSGESNGGPKLLVSPAEPEVLRAIGQSSLATERNGVDIMWAARGGLWGVQRKEIGDLVASRGDGRLSKELAQMANLEVAVLLVEGRLNWGPDDRLASRFHDLSRRQLHGMLWSVRMRGIWVERTDTLHHTIDVVRWLADWSRKERHSGLRTRPGPEGNWGHVSDREWGIHLLSGIDGIGAGTAGAIYDHFEGVPMKWTVSEDQLMEVPGIGKKRARQMVEALKVEEG